VNSVQEDSKLCQVHGAIEHDCAEDDVGLFLFFYEFFESWATNGCWSDNPIDCRDVAGRD
jgi:hypothetical protein